METAGAAVNVVRIGDGTSTDDPRVVGEVTNGAPSSVAAAAELLNQSDVAVIQHEYGIYGGVDGADVLDIVDALRIPSIVVLHTVVKEPTAHQRLVLESLAAAASQVVVMSTAAKDRLKAGYRVDSRKVSTIAHGAVVTPAVQVSRRGRPTILTWGLLGPGKGIERVIDAMAALRDLPGRPRYLVAGGTHPKVLAAEGEAYRESLQALVRRHRLVDSVSFAPGYLDGVSLRAAVQSAAVIVLPYDSTDQVTSGVLVEAVANGRPVVATAFPHAVEMLGGGVGIVVDHDDPDAMTAALRQVLTQPRLAGAMAAEARASAPQLAWPLVARTYLALARRLCTERSALV
ncbi:glycosyltransferase [Mycolicibacterium sp. CBM1]